MVFSHVETLFDPSKQIFFLSIVCSDCKSNIFFMLRCMKTNFLLNYCMQWLQEYCFPHDGTFSDESLQEYCLMFSGCCNIVWCIKTNFLFKYCMQYLQEYDFLHIVRHQNTFCFEVYECSNIARLLSTWWNIVWCIKTINFFF